MSCLMTKPTKWLCAQRRLRSASESLQMPRLILSLRWAHMLPFCWFCNAVAHIKFRNTANYTLKPYFGNSAPSIPDTFPTNAFILSAILLRSKLASTESSCADWGLPPLDFKIWSRDSGVKVNHESSTENKFCYFSFLLPICEREVVTTRNRPMHGY